MSNKPIIFRTGHGITIDEHRAVKAVAQGQASAGDQALCIAVIAKKLCGLNDLAYVPGSFDETAFMSGRQFVGRQIEFLINQPLAPQNPGEVTDE